MKAKEACNGNSYAVNTIEERSDGMKKKTGKLGKEKKLTFQPLLELLDEILTL